MTTRTLRPFLLVLSLGCMGFTSAFLYAHEQNGLSRRAAELRTPVIPIDCARARGVENDDFTPDHNSPGKCWVDLPSFHRLYPEVAAATDVAATIRLNAEDELPTEQRDRTPLGTLLRAVVIVASLPVLLLLVELLSGWRASISRWPRPTQTFL